MIPDQNEHTYNSCTISVQDLAFMQLQERYGKPLNTQGVIEMKDFLLLRIKRKRFTKIS